MVDGELAVLATETDDVDTTEELIDRTPELMGQEPKILHQYSYRSAEEEIQQSEWE